MKREIQEPHLDQYGAEAHPGWGMIRAARVSGSATLFDSEIQHRHFVTVSISPATRKRDLNTDWVHGDINDLIEVEMSEAQWASFVSSMNTTGVPCTIRRTEGNRVVPGFPYAPRLAVTMNEAKEAATYAFDNVLQALAKLEEVEQAEDSTPKKRKEALFSLKCAIQNTGPNVEFAGKRLAEHAENVVQKARADIEAIVTQRAVQLGIDPRVIGFSLEGSVPKEIEQ